MKRDAGRREGGKRDDRKIKKKGGKREWREEKCG